MNRQIACYSSTVSPAPNGYPVRPAMMIYHVLDLPPRQSHGTCDGCKSHVASPPELAIQAIKSGEERPTDYAMAQWQPMMPNKEQAHPMLLYLLSYLVLVRWCVGIHSALQL